MGPVNFVQNFADLKDIKRLEQKDKKAALKAACQEFEAVILYEILKGLEKTVPKDGLFKQSLQTEIYQDLFYQEVAKILSKRGTGIARLLYHQLSQKYGGLR